MIHVPPPPIVQQCAYQIEINDVGSRAYKCLTEQEHSQILAQREKESQDFDNSVRWLFTRWQLYLGLFIVFLLWMFWPRTHDYYPYERF